MDKIYGFYAVTSSGTTWLNV